MGLGRYLKSLDPEDTPGNDQRLATVCSRRLMRLNAFKHDPNYSEIKVLSI
jgi:hypothetical protein